MKIHLSVDSETPLFEDERRIENYCFLWKEMNFLSFIVGEMPRIYGENFSPLI